MRIFKLIYTRFLLLFLLANFSSGKVFSQSILDPLLNWVKLHNQAEVDKKDEMYADKVKNEQRLIEQNKRLRDSYSNLNSIVSKIQKNIIRLQNNLKTCQESNEELVEKNKFLEKEIKLKEIIIEENKELIEQKNALIDQLKKELKLCNDSLSSTTKLLKECEEEKKALQDKLLESTFRIDGFQRPKRKLAKLIFGPRITAPLPLDSLNSYLVKAKHLKKIIVSFNTGKLDTELADKYKYEVTFKNEEENGSIDHGEIDSSEGEFSFEIRNITKIIEEKNSSFKIEVTPLTTKGKKGSNPKQRIDLPRNNFKLR